MHEAPSLAALLRGPVERTLAGGRWRVPGACALQSIGALEGRWPPAVSAVTTLLLSGNPLQCLRGLDAACPAVRVLSLADSALPSLQALAPLRRCRQLHTLLLRGSPVTRAPLYRQRVLAMFACEHGGRGCQLQVLDEARVDARELGAAATQLREYAAALARAVSLEARILQLSHLARVLALHAELLRAHAVAGRSGGGSECAPAAPALLLSRLLRAWHFYAELPAAAQAELADAVEARARQLLRTPAHGATASSVVEDAQRAAGGWMAAMRALCDVQVAVIGDLAGPLLREAREGLAAATTAAAAARAPLPPQPAPAHAALWQTCLDGGTGGDSGGVCRDGGGASAVSPPASPPRARLFAAGRPLPAVRALPTFGSSSSRRASSCGGYTSGDDGRAAASSAFLAGPGDGGGGGGSSSSHASESAFSAAVDSESAYTVTSSMVGEAARRSAPAVRGLLQAATRPRADLHSAPPAPQPRPPAVDALRARISLSALRRVGPARDPFEGAGYEVTAADEDGVEEPAWAEVLPDSEAVITAAQL